MLPMIDPGLVDRLAHLFGTRRTYWPVVLEEAQATGFERKLAVIEQRAYFAFGVLDHILVHHTMDAARQHRVEMLHQFGIIAVVATQIFKAVREILSAREMLLEAGHAAGQRMAARIDDSCIRQNQMN